MAFLHARPINTTKPICVKMLTSISAAITAATEQSRHIGTTRITASGSVQLSYWAASTRNTSTTASREDEHGRVAGLQLQQGQLGPFGAAWTAASPLGDAACMTSMRLARAHARRRAAVDLRAAGYRLYRVIIAGPVTSRSLARPAKGTIWPCMRCEL